MLAIFLANQSGYGKYNIAEEKLRVELVEAIALVGERLRDSGFELERLREADGFDKLKALKDAKEIINQNDESRKGFEIAARAVFRKFKACLTSGCAEEFKSSYQAMVIPPKISGVQK